jgi:NADH-quinone oxidoreductase subunit M
MLYKVIAVLAVLGVVLGAWYMLYLVQRVFFGPLKEPAHEGGGPRVRDLSLREVAALAPLVVFVFWIGLQPEFFLSRMQPTLAPMAEGALQALDDRSDSRPALAHQPLKPSGESSRVE